MFTLVVVVVVVALLFEYINGFHDTANSIATVVGTKALTPTKAIALAAVGNLVGSFLGQNVVKTVSSGLVTQGAVPDGVAQHMLICALLGGITWNLITWWFGLPSSSTHALLGGLAGAVLGMTGGDLHSLVWDGVNAEGKSIGYLHKVVIPMLTSPVIGWIAGLALGAVCLKMAPTCVKYLPLRAQKALRLIGPGYLAVAHGMSDAQKTAGIIAIGLIAGTKAHAAGMPEWMQLANTDHGAPQWVRIVCALVMAAGTAAGGWKIIQTLGTNLVPLKPSQGFAAEVTAATLLAVTQNYGMTVSTTHAISTAIMGAGAADGFDKVDKKLVHRILGAWVLTIPAAGIVSFLFVWLGHVTGLIPR